MELVLKSDQRIDDKGNILPPGTLIATVTFNEENPASFQNLSYLGHAISSGRVIDKSRLKIEEKKPPVPGPQMTDLIDEG